MEDPLPILPFTKPVRAVVQVPGSKSLTNRALILAALGKGVCRLEGALFSQDTEIMIEALRKLGFAIEADPVHAVIEIEGHGGKIPAHEADLFVGNAGTAARFLTAFCCLAKEGVYRIDGVPQMRKRPIHGLIEALRSQGAEIRSANEHFPIEIRPHGLKGGRVTIDASESSQMLSALLMIAPYAREDVTFHLDGDVRLPFVVMTLQLMDHFGQEVFQPNVRRFLRQRTDGVWEFQGSQRVLMVSGANSYRSRDTYAIEPDATAASYFLTLPIATGGKVEVDGLSARSKTLQGDGAYFSVLSRMGCRITEGFSQNTASEFLSFPASFALDEDFRGFSDTFLTLAAVTPLLPGQVSICGIEHTRKQETDRIAGMVHELQKLGQKVSEASGSISIFPAPVTLTRDDSLIEIDTYDDHRFAMSFAILGCHDLRGDGRPWLAIRNPGCCGKTFPRFFDVLDDARRQ